MPYVKRTVVAGDVIETKKEFTPRIHTQGAKRAKNFGKTEEAQMKVTVLVDNRDGEQIKGEWGLSFYIEYFSTQSLETKSTTSGPASYSRSDQPQ